jgi:hypothetical protein
MLTGHLCTLIIPTTTFLHTCHSKNSRRSCLVRLLQYTTFTRVRLASTGCLFMIPFCEMLAIWQDVFVHAQVTLQVDSDFEGLLVILDQLPDATRIRSISYRSDGHHEHTENGSIPPHDHSITAEGLAMYSNPRAGPRTFVEPHRSK